MKSRKEFCFKHSGGEDIYLFALRNAGTEVKVTNYGGIITSFMINDLNIVLGFEDVKDYMAPDYLAAYPYFGCAIGRYANRVKNASFEIDGVRYNISKNRGNDHLHGGLEGFQQKVWKLISFIKDPNPVLILEYNTVRWEDLREG